MRQNTEKIDSTNVDFKFSVYATFLIRVIRHAGCRSGTLVLLNFFDAKLFQS